MDYFIASLSYGPKTASGFISPLSAECMLQYKKKAAAYMKALRKVGVLLLIVIHVLIYFLHLVWTSAPLHVCLFLFSFWDTGSIDRLSISNSPLANQS